MTITAKIIADSVNPQGNRLTTLQLRYPKFIHGDFMTHRAFSRNASSSRAIPVERLIQDVMDDPAMPVSWGKNQKGMQAKEENYAEVKFSHDPFAAEHYDGCFIEWDATPMPAKDAWLYARDHTIKMARAFAEAGYHKQIVNRLLEPFCHINVVVTTTEFSNFFALRDHPDAQPEIQVLARAMKQAMAESAPVRLEPGEWHLPYVTDDDLKELPYDKIIRLSVARCARVSYLTQDGKTPSIEADLALYDRLVGSQPLHASPCEHQATPDSLYFAYAWKHPEEHGNLRGWRQYRRTLPGGSV